MLQARLQEPVIPALKKKRSPRKILLSGQCTGCGKASKYAAKVSDFWIEYCEDCKSKPITLDKSNITRTGRYVEG